MARGLFSDDPVGDIFAGFFGGMNAVAAPPDSIPLRLLGLDAIPSTRDAVKAAFRSKVMTAHPDLAAYTIPHLRQAAEAVVTNEADVQELMWARDILLRKVPVTTADVTRAHTQQPSPEFEPAIRVRYKPRPCKQCGEPPPGRSRLTRTGRWRGLCYRCKNDAENARLRDLREAARAHRCCEGCGGTFTPKRADGRHCKPACRQLAYRKRNSR